MNCGYYIKKIYGLLTVLRRQLTKRYDTAELHCNKFKRLWYVIVKIEKIKTNMS